MDDLIKEFLVESNENLDRLDNELVKLETDPSSQELLSSIFRTIHTIKGSCGFLGFSKLEKVAHVGESLLSRLRDGKLSLTPEFTSGLLAMVDAIRTMLGEIQTTEQDGNETYPDLIESLNQLQQQSTDTLPKSALGLSLKEPEKKNKAPVRKGPQENPGRLLAARIMRIRRLPPLSRPRACWLRRRKNHKRGSTRKTTPAPRTLRRKPFASTFTCWTG